MHILSFLLEDIPRSARNVCLKKQKNKKTLGDGEAETWLPQWRGLADNKKICSRYRLASSDHIPLKLWGKRPIVCLIVVESFQLFWYFGPDYSAGLRRPASLCLTYKRGFVGHKNSKAFNHYHNKNLSPSPNNLIQIQRWNSLICCPLHLEKSYLHIIKFARRATKKRAEQKWSPTATGYPDLLQTNLGWDLEKQILTTARSSELTPHGSWTVWISTLKPGSSVLTTSNRKCFQSQS